MIGDLRLQKSVLNWCVNETMYHQIRNCCKDFDEAFILQTYEMPIVKSSSQMKTMVG